MTDTQRENLEHRAHMLARLEYIVAVKEWWQRLEDEIKAEIDRMDGEIEPRAQEEK